MALWIVRRCFSINEAKFTGIEKEIGTRSSSILEPRKGGGKIPFWAYGTIMIAGAMTETALLTQQWIISQRFTHPVLPIELKKSSTPFQSG